MLTDKEQEEIRQKLLGLEEDPPADGWKKISTQIQPDNKPFPYWWLFAALLLLLTTGGIFYFTQQKKEKASTELAAGTTMQEKIYSAPEKETENFLQDPEKPTSTPAPKPDLIILARAGYDQLSNKPYVQTCAIVLANLHYLITCAKRASVIYY